MKKTIEIEMPDGYEVTSSDNRIYLKLIKPIDSIEVNLNLVPKSWEEFCECKHVDKEYCITSGSEIKQHNNRCRLPGGDKNLYKTKEDAEAFLAFIQLRRILREWVYIDELIEEIKTDKDICTAYAIGYNLKYGKTTVK